MSILDTRITQYNGANASELLRCAYILQLLRSEIFTAVAMICITFWAFRLLMTGFLRGLHFEAGSGGDRFLRNIDK
jgi:hypothetical protein